MFKWISSLFKKKEVDVEDDEITVVPTKLPYRGYIEEPFLENDEMENQLPIIE